MKFLLLICFLIYNTYFGQLDQSRTKSGSLIFSKENKIAQEYNKQFDETVNIYDLDIVKNIPKVHKKNKYNIAVVIGNKEYFKDNVPNVEFALNDASLINYYLQNSLGYSSENIIFLKNATQSELNLTFGTPDNYRGKLYDYVIPDKSEIFLYYSGHGAPNTDDEKSYLVPSDCDPDKVALNGYSLETLYNNLDKLALDKNVKHITIVLDACFSGNSPKGSLLSNISPIEIKVKSNTLQFQNKTIFTSTSENQVSTWYEDKHMSLFTYFFLKGLNGEADFNHDNTITSSELIQFTSDESFGVPYWSRRINSRNQMPQLIGLEDYKIFSK